MAKERRRLPLDQDVARSMGATSLQQIKKSTPETSGLFNSKVKIFYDRISKKVILGGEELCIKKRFISLSVAEATFFEGIPEGNFRSQKEAHSSRSSNSKKDYFEKI